MNNATVNDDTEDLVRVLGLSIFGLAGIAARARDADYETVKMVNGTFVAYFWAGSIYSLWRAGRRLSLAAKIDAAAFSTFGLSICSRA